MSVVTLADLRTRVLERADMLSGSGVIGGGASDGGDHLRSLINASGQELHGLLTARFEDAFVDPTPTLFSVTGSANVHSLPSDFLKARGVELSVGGEWRPVHSFKWEDRGRFATTSASLRGSRSSRRYRLMGNSIYLVPEASAAGDYRMWYCARFAKLVGEQDELPDGMVQGGWDEYIVVDAAIKCRDTEESDVSVLMAQKQALIQRVELEASGRDASEQGGVTDVVGFGCAYGGWDEF